MSATRIVWGATWVAPGYLDFTTAPLAFILISDAFSNIGQDAISQALKMFALAAMAARLAVDGRISRAMLVTSLLVLFLLTLNIYRSVSLIGAAQDLMRYLLPVILMVYIASYRYPVERLLGFLFLAALSNNVYQIYAYAAAALNWPAIHPPIYDGGIVLRASGWLGSVMGLAFLNFCCYVAACCYRDKLRSRLLERVFLIGAIASFSLKLMPAILLAVFIFSSRPWMLCGAVAAVLGLVYWRFVEVIAVLVNLVQTKLDFYLLIGNSARFESYRVAAEVLAEGDLLGKGIGTFGGPASVKYGSPIYGLYDFRWFDTPGMNTTDTFYPHLFVELGLISALVYLVYCLFPLYLLRGVSGDVRKGVVIILFGLVVDSFFSFGLNAPVYLIAAYGACFALVSMSQRSRSAHQGPLQVGH